MISPQPDPMVGIGMTFAVLLALVFAVAGVTKLISPATTSAELTDLGVPVPRFVARSLPIVELAIAAALIVTPPWGSVAAAGTLTIFTAFLLRAIRAGSSASCGCLGALSSAPVGPATIARNGALLAMALWVGVVPEPVIPDGASALAATSLALIATVAVQLVALHDRIGRVWSVSLAGEQSTPSPTQPTHPHEGELT